MKIAVLAGDGIGPEIVQEAVNVLDTLAKIHALDVQYDYADVGGAGYESAGTPLPAESLALAKKADAVLLGAVGGPQWESLDKPLRPEAGLLSLRYELGLFANYRPAKVHEQLIDASTLKADVVRGVDILVVRELVGGIYFGQPRGIKTLDDGQQQGSNTLVYTTSEIERIAHIAFQAARKRSGRVCSIDKANVLESTELWRQVVCRVHSEEYSDVELSHMYVDNAAMQLIRNPKQFDVMLTTNMFGDILSDEASMLTGSIGLLPSASLGKEHAMYEPIHGSAPDIAGQDKANPLATILSVAMMLRYSLGREDMADKIEQAVEQVLANGVRTADIAVSGEYFIGCAAMGHAVCAQLEAM
ncbi:MAG: 3-isopropylmalate dehydrogenase [Mariprofundaceae bacterium]|nr:3-isopropylmalate dehydrogenase [Mariprofundaceae bacterium]